MNIYILRHGLAVDPGTAGYERDADRPLTAEGEHKVREIAKAMQLLELNFDLILSSPFTRARQTAEIVAKVLDLRRKLEFTEALASGGNAETLVRMLGNTRPRAEDVLLVGHEPDLSELISFLVSGSSSFPVELKKGGFCKLGAARLKHGRCAILEWLLTPRQMILMAKGKG